MKRWLIFIAALFLLSCGTARRIAREGVSELGKTGLVTEEERKSLERASTALRKSFQEITDREEYYIGRAVAAHIIEKHTVYDDEALTDYVNTVGKTVAWASDKPETYGGYHFLILDTHDPVAYAAPGGFIFMSVGLLSMMKNEEELAGVLAHEVVHVNKRHGLSAIKKSRLMSAFSILTEEGKKYTSDEMRQLVDAYEGSLDDIVKTLVEKGYSRAQEGEADRFGALFAHRSGYNPQGLVSFLSTLKRQYGDKREIGLLKTHPKPADRLVSLEEYLRKEGLEGKTEPTRTSRFAAMKKLLS